MKKIKIIDDNLKFTTVPLKDLKEEFIFDLIKNNTLSKQDFAHWVENVRDEWFAIGAQTIGH